jgi:kumamolisin
MGRVAFRSAVAASGGLAWPMLVKSLMRLALLGSALGIVGAAQAQQVRVGEPAAATAPTPQAGCFVRPQGQEVGRFHTNYVLASKDCQHPLVMSKPTPFRVVGPMMSAEESENPDVSTYEVAGEDPASLGCLYVHSPSTAGCPPNNSSGEPLTGGPSYLGYGVIAIVDAYDNPDADADLGFFDSYFGLSAPPCPVGLTCTTNHVGKIYANGNGDCVTPPANSNWIGEESLDIEWAHVFAPKAAIVLVEACSSSDTDLLYAEQVAFKYIVANYAGIGGQVTNSWGGPEFSGEISDDPLFADFNYTCCTWNTHIVAFASAGDCGYLDDTDNGPCYDPGNNNYPSASPWVVSAGGTGVLRYTNTKGVADQFYAENCWSGSGGGPSAYEKWSTSGGTGGHMGAWAPYQYPIFGDGINYGSGLRVTPDLASDADPASGVYVYDEYNGGWFIFGGTSVASPSLASIINRAGNKLGTVNIEPIVGGANFAAEENVLLYSQLATKTAYGANFYDVKTGSNGGPGAKVSYDECTGVGSPRGLLGK